MIGAAGIHRRPRGVEDVEDVVDVELVVGHLGDDARLGPEDDDALDRRPGRERAILGRPLLRFGIDADQHDANPGGADRDFLRLEALAVHHRHRADLGAGLETVSCTRPFSSVFFVCVLPSTVISTG